MGWIYIESPEDFDTLIKDQSKSNEEEDKTVSEDGEVKREKQRAKYVEK